MSTCRANRFESFFEVDGIGYKFFVTHSYEVKLAAISGILNSGTYVNYDPWNAFDDPGGTSEILHATKKPFTVISKSIFELKKYLSLYSPPYFTFVATDDKREKLYIKIATRISKKTDYTYNGARNKDFLFIKNNDDSPTKTRNTKTSSVRYR